MLTDLPKIKSVIEYRKDRLAALADFILSNEFKEQFVPAYLSDTAFIVTDIIKREITSPAAMLRLSRQEESELSNREALGTVAVFIPKNSLGLTLAKAVASSYLAGNRTIIYFPAALKKTGPIYARAITSFLDNIEVAEFTMSSAQFLRTCMKNPDIKAVVIYGDDSWVDAYKTLAREAGKKVIFEGPGNDPMVVFADANIDEAVTGAVEGGLINGGQSCSAIERFFVHSSIYDAFCQKLSSRIAELKTGAPADPATQIGPVFSKTIFSRMLRQIEDSVSMGAKIVTGGQVELDPTTGLSMLRPTVLSHCTAAMPIVREETFGPVFPLLPFTTHSELMQMLDQTRYGLNACTFGTVPEHIRAYLLENHRNVYFNSTQASLQNLESRLADGGFRRSGMIWDFGDTGNETTGLRTLTLELSKPIINI